MDTTSYFTLQFNQLQAGNGHSKIDHLRREAFAQFQRLGIPGVKHEEWKYTRVNSIFNKDYSFTVGKVQPEIKAVDIDQYRLPGDADANSLVFVNGRYTESLSIIRSTELIVLPLEEAAGNEFKEIVSANLGHSSNYIKDGIHALNTAFVQGGVFVFINRNKAAEHPVYIYNITDARSTNVLAMPRSLMFVSENARVNVVETYATIGPCESFTNQVMEMAVEKDGLVEYYKIQNDTAASSQVSTTHIRQLGKCHVHAVTITLNGGIVRNNMNVVMEASHSEAHLHGLYFETGNTHVDNHTIVDNRVPDCFSNELYKGVLDDQSTGVFNGKIFVRPQAQKTNAFQSNKNILLSQGASVNTKPQLEIFADDVKCSHGCTVGRLNEEGMFYLRSRGISESSARALLVQAFTADVVAYIKLLPIRTFVEQLIAGKFEVKI